MNFPEVTTFDVFKDIREYSLEINSQRMWDHTLLNQGNCKIESLRLGKGIPDSIVRFYSEDGSKYVWLMAEYKDDKSKYDDSFIQMSMYLGNWVYDSGKEGIDNFAGIISASSNHFTFVKPMNVLEYMKDFENIWKQNYRVVPSKAKDTCDIRWYYYDNIYLLNRGKIQSFRSEENTNLRLDNLIKGIYEEWNLL